MRILVTGGGGFIGSRVCAIAYEAGHDVAILDSFTRYIWPPTPIADDNVQQRLRLLDPNIEIIRGSTADAAAAFRAVLDFQPDSIIHLAALPLANLAIENPEQAVETIVVGTQNMLAAARSISSLHRFVYISSSMVYGDFETDPVAEDHPKNPIEIYGSVKLAGELLTRAYGRMYGLPWTIVRPSAVYGPTDNNERVLDKFVTNALKGHTLTLRGNGALDFTFVDDIAGGIVAACVSERGTAREYNITRGEAATLRQAVEIIRERVPSIVVEEEDPDPRLPTRGTLDVSRARAELGYEPRFDLRTGLQIYIDYKIDQMERLGAHSIASL